MPGPTNPSAQNPQVQITALDSPIKTSTRMRYTGQSNGYKLSMNTVGERIVNAKAQEILELIKSDHNLGHKVQDPYYLSIDWGNPLQARLTILHSGKPDEVITVDLSEKAFLKRSAPADIAAAKAAAEKVAKAIAAGRAAIENHAEPVKSGRVKIQQVDGRGAIHGAESSRTADVLGVRKGSNLSLAALSPVIRAEVLKLSETEQRKFMIELNTLMLFQGSKKEHLRARITALEAGGIEAAEKNYNAAKREHAIAIAERAKVFKKAGKLRASHSSETVRLQDLMAKIVSAESELDQLVEAKAHLPKAGQPGFDDAVLKQANEKVRVAQDIFGKLETERRQLELKLQSLEGTYTADEQAAEAAVASADAKMIAAKGEFDRRMGLKIAVETAQSSYKAKEADKTAAEAELSKLGEELNLKEAEIKRLEAKLTAETANRDAFKGDRGLATAGTNTDPASLKFVEYSATVATLEAQLATLKAALEARRQAIEGNQGAQTGSATVPVIPGEKQAIQARLDDIERDLQTLKIAFDSAREALDKIEKPVAELEAALAKLDKVDEFALAWGLLYRDRPEKSFEALKAHKNSIIDPQRKWYNRVPLLGIAELDDKKLKAYNADCLALWSKDTWDRSDLYFTVETTMSRGAENEVPFVDVMQGLLKLLDSGHYPTDEDLRGVAKSAGIEDQGEIEELFKQVKKIFEEAYKFKHDIERLKTADFENDAFWVAFKVRTLGDYVARIKAERQMAVSPAATPLSP